MTEPPTTPQKQVVTKFFGDVCPSVTNSLSASATAASASTTPANGNLDRLDEVVDSNVKIHGTTGEHGNLEEFKGAIRRQAPGFDDTSIVLDNMIGEGDHVSVTFTHAMTVLHEFMGLPVAGRRVQFGGAAHFVISGNKAVEIWMYEDFHGAVPQQPGGYGAKGESA